MHLDLLVPLDCDIPALLARITPQALVKTKQVPRHVHVFLPRVLAHHLEDVRLAARANTLFENRQAVLQGASVTLRVREEKRLTVRALIPMTASPAFLRFPWTMSKRQ